MRQQAAHATRFRLACVFAACLCGSHAARQKRQTKFYNPTVGDALDLQRTGGRLGRDWQWVSVITPGSSQRRVIDPKTGNFTADRYEWLAHAPTRAVAVGAV